MSYANYLEMRPRLRPAQQELRDNLRAVITDSGRSQPTVCMDAGLGVHHLSGCLTGSNWMPRERVEALAEALDLSPDELMGASMYKGESWLEARRRTSVVDWRNCPRWCNSRGQDHGVMDLDNDGRVTVAHQGEPWGQWFSIQLEYDRDTGAEVDRLASMRVDDGLPLGDDSVADVDLADLALIVQQAEQVAAWLRGEVVLP